MKNSYYLLMFFSNAFETILESIRFYSRLITIINIAAYYSVRLSN